jgi:hypothetical protein
MPRNANAVAGWMMMTGARGEKRVTFNLVEETG